MWQIGFLFLAVLFNDIPYFCKSNTEFVFTNLNAKIANGDISNIEVCTYLSEGFTLILFIIIKFRSELSIFPVTKVKNSY